MIHKLEDVLEMPQTANEGRWKIAKPIGSKSIKFRNKVKAAWAVLFGRAFAVEWK